MNKRNQILFVWDFHGTLEKDNVQAVMYLLNKTLEYFGIANEITLAETAKMYGLSWIDYFKYLYPTGDFSFWKKMKKKAVEIQIREKVVEKYIKPQAFAQAVVKKIKQEGHCNIILSNTAPKHIKHFANLVGIAEFIDEYLALDAHNTTRQETELQALKAEAIKDYLKDKRFNKIVKIGDRESDIAAGKAIGAKTYYFRNQFNRNHQLSIKPDYEISDLREVLKELE